MTKEIADTYCLIKKGKQDDHVMEALSSFRMGGEGGPLCTFGVWLGKTGREDREPASANALRWEHDWQIQGKKKGRWGQITMTKGKLWETGVTSKQGPDQMWPAGHMKYLRFILFVMSSSRKVVSRRVTWSNFVNASPGHVCRMERREATVEVYRLVGGCCRGPGGRWCFGRQQW